MNIENCNYSSVSKTPKSVNMPNPNPNYKPTVGSASDVERRTNK